MNVYIEDAIFDNVLINFTILSLTVFSLRQKLIFWKVLVSSMFGCFIAVFLTFFNLSFTIQIIIKVITGLIMCLMIVKRFDFANISLFFVVFLSFTFLMGGFCFFIIYLFNGEMTNLETLNYNLPINLKIIFGLLGLYVFFLIKAIQVFYKKQKIESFYYNLEIFCNNKKIKLKAYLDSGNLLQDSESGLPIIIVNFKTFNKIFNNQISVLDFLTNKLNHKIKGKYIKVNSVTTNSKMFIFEPKCVTLKEKNGQVKKINVLIGVANANFNNNFEVLLNPLAI